jgi:hypothetical protein
VDRQRTTLCSYSPPVTPLHPILKEVLRGETQASYLGCITTGPPQVLYQDGDWVAYPVDLQGERLLMERTAANARLLIHQFATLSALLFRSAEPEEAAAGDKRARTDLFREKLL